MLLFLTTVLLEGICASKTANDKLEQALLFAKQHIERLKSRGQIEQQVGEDWWEVIYQTYGQGKIKEDVTKAQSFEDRNSRRDRRLNDEEEITRGQILEDRNYRHDRRSNDEEDFTIGQSLKDQNNSYDRRLKDAWGVTAAHVLKKEFYGPEPITLELRQLLFQIAERIPLGQARVMLEMAIQERANLPDGRGKTGARHLKPEDAKKVLVDVLVDVSADYYVPEPTTSGKRRRGANQDPTRPSHENKRQRIAMEDDGEGEAVRDEIEDDGSVRTLDPTNHFTAHTQISILFEAWRNQTTSLEDDMKYEVIGWGRAVICSRTYRFCPISERLDKVHPTSPK
ncbi:MAG: hypothetical protein Q9221_006359 [Calogaya cf. arnoldii]